MLELLRLPASKFSPRVLGPGLLERTRLFDLLEQHVHAKLVLVHAPAGYGKSTLMAQWYARLRARGQGVGWIALDEDDNDTARLGAALSQALAPRSRGTADLFDAVNTCLQEQGRFALFIDDEEQLATPEAQRLIEAVLKLSPPDLQLVAGTRTQPQWLAPRWRVRNDYLEITARELSFRPEEISRYIRQRAGMTLDADTERYLAERSQGWPAALQLAAAEIRQGTPVRALFEQGATASANLFQYLSDEVMIHLRPEQHEFLLHTAFIEELSAPLCDAVTMRTDSAALLQELHRSNLPLQQVDAVSLTYRYHPLFAEFLLRQLRQRYPGLLPQLARRASEWCTRSGQPESAVEYALRSDSSDQLVECIRAGIERVFARGQIVTARRWLAAVGPGSLRAQPDLLVWYVWLHIYSNEFAAAQSALSELRQSRAGGTAQQYLLTALLAAAYGDYGQAAASAAQADALIDPMDKRTAAVLGSTHVLMHLMQGRFGEASQAVEGVKARALTPPVDWSIFVHACYFGSMLELALGNLRGAWRQVELPERRMQEAERAGEAGGNRNQLLALIAGARALVLYESDKLEDAEDALDRSEPFLNSLFSPSGRALWYLMRGRVLALRNDHDAYEDAMQDAGAYAARHGIGWMTGMILWERIDRDVSLGDVHRARAVAADALEQLDLDTPPAWIFGWDERFGPILSALRLLIHSGEAPRALRVLPTHLAHAQQQRRRLRLIRLTVLNALALQAVAEHGRAREALRQALELAAPTGALRVFLDEGGRCRGLLRELQRDVPLPAEPAELLGQLLACFDQAEPDGPREAPIEETGYPIPLSTRELQILRRLAEGHSNLAVGQQLFLSPNTVKWHLSQIYAKLGVKNRTQAVHVARQHRWTDLT